MLQRQGGTGIGSCAGGARDGYVWLRYGLLSIQFSRSVAHFRLTAFPSDSRAKAPPGRMGQPQNSRTKVRCMLSCSLALSWTLMVGLVQKLRGPRPSALTQPPRLGRCRIRPHHSPRLSRYSQRQLRSTYRRALKSPRTINDIDTDTEGLRQDRPGHRRHRSARRARRG